MPGPPPNPNARRKNDRQTGFTTLAGCRSTVPRLPTIKGRSWSAATRAAWAAWWASPQATRWTDDDVPQLVLVARLYEAALAGEQAALVELRQWSDRFGMTPLARLKNRWLVPAPETSTEAAAEAPSNVTSIDEFRALYG